MRRRLIVLSLAAALGLASGACGGGDDGANESAEAPPANTTEGTSTEAPAAKAKAEKKKQQQAQKKETRISEASAGEPTQTAPEQKTSAPATGNGDKQSGSDVPAGKVQATNDSPPEVTLAVIDAESAYVTKSLVRRYAEPLDQLEQSCSEAREALAEASLTASHDVRSQTGSKLSILDVLHEVVKDDPSGVCLPAFTAVARRHGAS